MAYTWLLFIIGVALGGSASGEPDPVYSANSKEILGAYRTIESDGVFEFEYAEIKYDADGNLAVWVGWGPDHLEHVAYLEFGNADEGVPFGVEVDDECDDPGCGALQFIEGTLLPEKWGTQWVPTLNIVLTVAYDYPVEEDDLEGEHQFALKMRWVNPIEDTIPYFKKVDLDPKVDQLLQDCWTQYRVFLETIDCFRGEQYDFRVDFANEAYDKFVKEFGFDSSIRQVDRLAFRELIRKRYDWQLAYAQHMVVNDNNASAFEIMKKIPDRLEDLFRTRRYDRFFLAQSPSSWGQYADRLAFIAVNDDRQNVVVFRFSRN